MKNKELKKRVSTLLKKGMRLDGRGPYEYRDIEIDKGCIETAEGSAKVKIGDNEIIAGVKTSVGQPYPDSPDDGNIMVSAEFEPMSADEYRPGPPQEDSIEVSRITDRGLRESDMIDTSKLVIESGEKVWSVGVDLSTINVDGDLFDISNIASVVSFIDMNFPKYEDGKVNYKELTDEKLEIKNIPIAVTLYKIGDTGFIVDPTGEEKSISDARLTVISIDENTVTAFQKGGEGTLTKDDVIEMTDVALDVGKDRREMIRKNYL